MRFERIDDGLGGDHASAPTPDEDCDRLVTALCLRDRARDALRVFTIDTVSDEGGVPAFCTTRRKTDEPTAADEVSYPSPSNACGGKGNQEQQVVKYAPGHHKHADARSDGVCVSRYVIGKHIPPLSTTKYIIQPISQ